MSPYYKAETYRAQSSVGYLVRRAKSLMMSHLEAAFAPYEISFIHWVVLMHLRDDLGRTAAEISRDACHDSGALTRVIDQLAQRGLIDRQRCPEDRRVVTLTLTDAGLQLVNFLVPIVVDLLNAALSGFTHPEIDTLTSLLTRLTHDLALMPAADDAPISLENAE